MATGKYAHTPTRPLPGEAKLGSWQQTLLYRGNFHYSINVAGINSWVDHGLAEQCTLHRHVRTAGAGPAPATCFSTKKGWRPSCFIIRGGYLPMVCWDWHLDWQAGNCVVAGWQQFFSIVLGLLLVGCWLRDSSPGQGFFCIDAPGTTKDHATEPVFVESAREIWLPAAGRG